MNENSTNNRLLVPIIILSISMIICCVIFSKSIKKAFQDKQNISVTGSARRSIKSDLGYLDISINGASTVSGSQAYQELLKQIPKVKQYLYSKGFNDSQFSYSIQQYIPVTNYDKDGHVIGISNHVYNQHLIISSNNVDLIQAISLDITSLIMQGIDIAVNPPRYLYTKLKNEKVEIQADAAKDAKQRAMKIAEATGSSLGGIVYARMGILQIIPANSNEVSDYGINDESSIDKEIVSVVNVTFVIDD